MRNQDIKRVMLINPSNTMPKDSIRRLTTPLGLLYMGSVLKKSGYEVNILDSPCEGYTQTRLQGDQITYGLSDDEIKDRISDYSPDIVGVTSMFSAHQKNALDCCDLVESVSDARVVLGGIHPSLDPQSSIIHPSVDYVIVGEGEFRLLKLIEDINQGRDSFDLDGIAYKTSGKSFYNPMTSRIEDLDSLPLPDRGLVEMEKYISIGVPFGPFSRKERVEQIMTSRGCPFTCNFCSTVNYWGHSFRGRSVENIITEIDDLVSRYKIQEIQFADDNLTVNKSRAKELFKRMIPYGLSWCTPNGIMAQTLDKEMVNLMADSGAYQVSLAIESGNERVRKEIINKVVPSKDKIKDLIDIFHSKKVQVHGLFIVGFPGESVTEMKETFSYPRETGFDSASFFLATPMIGSSLYKECLDKGYIPPGFIAGDLKHYVIDIPSTSQEYVLSADELEKMVDKETREFNEWANARDPDIHRLKFEQFLKRHKDNADLILGRVT